MKYCTKCGNQMSDEMIFCQKCGEKNILTKEFTQETVDYKKDRGDKIG